MGSIALTISRFHISISGKKVPTIKKFPFKERGIVFKNSLATKKYIPLLAVSSTTVLGFIESHSRARGKADKVIS